MANPESLAAEQELAETLALVNQTDRAELEAALTAVDESDDSTQWPDAATWSPGYPIL